MKSEPRSSPLPTPHSNDSARPQTNLKRGRSDENASSPRRAINLGDSILKRARHEYSDNAPIRSRARQSQPGSPVIDLSQLEAEHDPMASFEPYNKRPKLRFDQLDDDQKRVVDLATKKRKSIFCSGGAGSGKSGCCEIIVHELRLIRAPFAVIAPTGTAAVNIGAQTIHSFFGWAADENMGIEDFLSNMKTCSEGKACEHPNFDHR